MNDAAWLAPPLVVPTPWLPVGSGGGALKSTPEDFVVEEIPAYEASGEGDFLYLWVEKVDISGPALARVISERLGIPRSEIGMAGMKDRHARTRQWISVPASLPQPPEAIEGAWGGSGEVRLLDARRHSNKLRTGHLRGNRFRVRVRGRAAEGDDAVGAALAAAATHGMANTFGAQRFSGGDTVARGLRLLAGHGAGPPRMRRLAASAVQGAFFNHWLAARGADELLVTALPGDVLMKRVSGGVFICGDPEIDTPRLAGELVVSGPLPGSRPSRAQGDALARELAIHELLGTPPEAFRALGRLGRGARRPALIFPEGPAIERDGDGLVVSFELPSGSYATVLMALLLGPDHVVGAQEEPVDDGEGE